MTESTWAGTALEFVQKDFGDFLGRFGGFITTPEARVVVVLREEPDAVLLTITLEKK